MVLFFAISAILSVLMFFVPFVSANGTFVDLDGAPGVMDHGDLWSKQDPFTMILYGLGDMVCHQQMSRTIILNGSEMPICIRDLGLLLGFAIGCAVTTVKFGHPAIYRHARAYVVITFILIFTDWLIQHVFDLNVPFTRLTTGLLAGAGFTLILYCWIITIYSKSDIE